MGMTLSDVVTSQEHLFYYANRMVRVEDGIDVYSIDIAQKVAVRKNDNFAFNGFEFLIYNLYQGPNPELCNGIRQTEIRKDALFEVSFVGKGYSSNGVSLSDLCGFFKYDEMLFQYSKGKVGNNMLSKYENVFVDKTGLFSFTKNGIDKFLMETLPLITTNRNGESIYWEKIRYIILSYYIQKNLIRFDANLVTRNEWEAAETYAFCFDKHEILHVLETVCDSAFYNYSLAKRAQDEASAISVLKKLLLYQRAYYYVYSTLKTNSLMRIELVNIRQSAEILLKEYKDYGKTLSPYSPFDCFSFAEKQPLFEAKCRELLNAYRGLNITDFSTEELQEYEQLYNLMLELKDEIF